MKVTTEATASFHAIHGHRVSSSLRWLEKTHRPLSPSSAALEFHSRPHQVAERLTEHAAYSMHRRKIHAMSDLPEGSETYSAKPPGEAAIELALRFVDLLEKRRLRIKWSAPTADDSIMVVLDTGAVRQEWEFYSDGDAAVMIQEAGGEKRYLDLDASEFAAHLPR